MREKSKASRPYSLTICTVNYKTEAILGLNKRLLLQLNSSVDITWLVVNNTRYDEERSSRPLLDTYFTELPCVARPKNIYGMDSYHHGFGLNSCLEHVHTRYMLVLDPDFFILMNDAILHVLLHMNKHGLAFFGAPWHPKYIKKYRDFPCPHCLFIDTDIAKVESLDFAPKYEDGKLTDRQFLPDWALWKQFAGFLKLCKGIDKLTSQIVKQDLIKTNN